MKPLQSQRCSLCLLTCKSYCLWVDTILHPRMSRVWDPMVMGRRQTEIKLNYAWLTTDSVLLDWSLLIVIVFHESKSSLLSAHLVWRLQLHQLRPKWIPSKWHVFDIPALTYGFLVILFLILCHPDISSGCSKYHELSFSASVSVTAALYGSSNEVGKSETDEVNESESFSNVDDLDVERWLNEKSSSMVMLVSIFVNDVKVWRKLDLGFQSFPILSFAPTSFDSDDAASHFIAFSTSMHEFANKYIDIIHLFKDKETEQNWIQRKDALDLLKKWIQKDPKYAFHLIASKPLSSAIVQTVSQAHSKFRLS